MNTNQLENEESAESIEFDTTWLHNFGPLDPIPIGARALCGAESTNNDSGEIEPLRTECCPICLALTDERDSEKGKV